jgi:hypothetical protein
MTLFLSCMTWRSCSLISTSSLLSLSRKLFSSFSKHKRAEELNKFCLTTIMKTCQAKSYGFKPKITAREKSAWLDSSFSVSWRSLLLTFTRLCCSNFTKMRKCLLYLWEWFHSQSYLFGMYLLIVDLLATWKDVTITNMIRIGKFVGLIFTRSHFSQFCFSLIRLKFTMMKRQMILSLKNFSKRAKQIGS